MFRLLAGIFSVVFLASSIAAYAQDYVPDRRLVMTRDVDFPGGDLANIFDTTLGACRAACLADANCGAFTFNSRSNACFPKSAAAEPVPYEGAVSGEVRRTLEPVRAVAPARASELSFLRTNDLAQARRQAETLSERHYANGFTAEQFINAARDDRNGENPLSAWRFTGAAVSLTDTPDQWVQYALDALAVAEKDSNRRRNMRDTALAAAINAYLRSTKPPEQVLALSTIANALEQLGRGRDTIPTLRLALDLQPRDDTERALDRAIRLFGFNLAETEVDSDAADPRICAIFSEELSKTVDYADYVQTETPGIAVSASGRQVCVSGLNHGERYRFTFREGLPSADGETLQKSVEITQYVRDRTPSVRFPGRAYILPAAGDAAVPVVAVNATELDLILYSVTDRNILRTMQDRYFGRPIDNYDAQTFRTEVAEEIWRGTGDVQSELNRDVTSRLPMAEIMGDLRPGVYALQASIPGADAYDAPPATQWFVISDLGLTTFEGTDGLHVVARALSDVSAITGADVTLISRGNTPLETVRTDADGYARFDPGLIRGTGAAAPGLLTVRNGDDFAFLSLTDPGFDLSDRGVEGRPAAPPIDVFLTTERGAYRAGETINALALARDGSSKAIPGLPLTAILTRPDGVEYSRTNLADQGAGGRLFNFSLGGGVPRGTWTLAVYADPEAAPLSDTKLLVEDFLPERIDFDINLPDGPLRLGGEPRLGISARYLFGAPGADLPVDGELTFRGTSRLEAFPGYIFGRHTEPFGTRRGYLESGNTDEDGEASLGFDLPDLQEVMQPLEARITVSVREGSNRPVERRVTKPVLMPVELIGVRPLFDDVLPENAEASFEIIALDPGLNRIAMPVKWTINRVQTRYQWYSSFGNWNWDPVTRRTRIASGEAVLDPSAPLTVSAPVEWGEYEIKVERTDGTYVATSTGFSAGWYGTADAAATPDLLEASLNAESYRSGDTARLRIVPRMAGTALVTVMSNRLIDMKLVPVTEGENTIDLPVTDEWGAGAYVSASVIRPMNVAAGQNPSRALGLAHASIDPGERRLSASFDVGDSAQPRSPMPVSLSVDGIKDGETAYAMIAAVDVGILNLTGFDAPDPSGHYFGQRALGMGIRDVYGRLIDGLNGAMGAVRSGGDATRQLRAESPPPTEELVAYVSGPLTVVDGKVETEFQIPEFNGTVRLMAVVWSETGVGEATADVLVRDPVVVTATLPRLLAPGDTSQLLLEVVHATGPTGRMPLNVSASGLDLAGLAPSSLDLGPQQKQVVTIQITAGAPGLASMTVTLETPDGEALTKSLLVPVERNDPVIQRRSQVELAAGGVFTLDQNAFAGFLPGTGSLTLSAGPLARFDAPGLLSALDQYPYGCTEQITSRAMPLLYLDQVASAMGLASRDNLVTRVEQAIGEVLTNQASNGAFGLWRPDRGDLWLDAYVTDFLTRAKSGGYAVPDIPLRNALDNLRNQVNSAPDFENGGEGLAYALFVLARSGAASMSDLRYYADVKAEAFGSAMALAQVGAALASYGDSTRADAMFRRASSRLNTPETDTRSWRDDYGTDLRDAAAVLTLAVEAGSTAIDVNAISSRVAPSVGEVAGRSTQESVWSLLAANALLDSNASGLTKNGAPVTGPLVQVLDQDTLVPVEIANTGASPTMVTVSTFGVPVNPEPAGGNGYSIGRSYFDLEGNPIDISTIASGTRFVTVLTVKPFEDAEARLMVNDPLPAGFEIDNPNLLRGGDVRALDWLKLSNNVQNSEFRQNRFLAAVDHYTKDQFQLAYIARAIAPGTYHHPPASVEDMYRPIYRARTETGQVTVTP